MPAMDGTPEPPQISKMFQKFALAFKTKTFEFFADEEETPSVPAADEADGFSLFDSAEEFITDQKVVVIKLDTACNHSVSPIRPMNTQLVQTLVSSLFATLSSFEASYLQLQTAHVPFDDKGVQIADRALVSHLRRLSDVRQWYLNVRRNPSSNFDVPIGSSLEAQVQENQNKLRALDIMINRLQSDIDAKDDEVSVLRCKLDNLLQSNSKLSHKLSKNLKANVGTEVLLTTRVFDSMLRDAVRSMHCFTKILIRLTKQAGWDLEMAANSVYSDVKYAKKGHNRYAFLSYVCLGMFRGFDLSSFNLDGFEATSNGDSPNEYDDSSLKHLVEHASINPVEFLRRNPNRDFSKFCEKKYEELVHPTMESSIFSNLDRKEAVVVEAWGSLSVFYESFVKMSSSVWLLHKLAYSFSPVVEIFQVERGVEFSIIYMEDVTTRRGGGVIHNRLSSSWPKVEFTVVPGFRVGATVIQSQVYLTGSTPAV